jgi:hypothetical protein
MSGISIPEANKTCAVAYKGDPKAIAVCQRTAGSLIRKIVANKPKVCQKFCGCK